MNNFKRIQISIIRNKRKSLLLVFISLALGILVVSSISIYQSLNAIDSTIKKQLSPSVLISAKDNYNLDGDVWVDLIDEENTNPIFNKYLNDACVNYGDILYTQYTSVSNPLIGNLPLIVGVNNPQLVDYLNGEYDNIRGRLFTQEEMNNDSNVIVMVENTKNGPYYEVGDFIEYNFEKFTSFFNETPTIIESVKFEIIGVLEISDDMANQTLNNLNASTRAYIPYGTLESMMNRFKDWELTRVSQLSEDSTDYGYDIRTGNIEFYRAYYKLNSTDDLEDFEKALEEDLSDYPIFEIQSDYANYKEVQSSTNRIQKLSIFILLVSIVASIIILTIIIHIYIKDRQNEVGLLLSLGQRKKQILLLFVIEILVLCSIGIIGSFMFGDLISEYLINSFILNQDVFNEYVQIISTSNELSIQYFGIALFVEMIVASISSIFPLCTLMRINPKNLLK